MASFLKVKSFQFVFLIPSNKMVLFFFVYLKMNSEFFTSSKYFKSIIPLSIK